jgi:tetratricopeptide (TPR) repeat protein
MKHLVFAIIFLLGIVNNVFSQNQDSEALLQKANDSYINKDYTLAIELYEQIVNQGFTAPELNYNLGNAYYKSENYTKAILNYERAIKQNPNFDDAKNNLKLANLHLRDKINSVPESNFSALFNLVVKGISLNSWAAFTLIFLAVSLGLFLLYLFSTERKLRKFAFSFGVVFLLICFGALCLGFYSESINSQSSDAIITETVVTAKSSPDDSGTDLFRLHEGLKVSIKDKSADWIEIRIADGRVGWVKSTSLEKI